MRKRRMFLVAGACLATLSLTVGSAMADPTGPVPPPYRQLAGVGAETTQGLFNVLSDIIKDGTGTKIIASYDNAPQPSQIQTKASAACLINRPSQGGAGTDALVASMQANDHCVDFARVVTNDSATRPAGLTYIPFAVDALTYATRDDSVVPRSLTLAQLTAIYNCQTAFEPLIGVFGAGNRTFFLKKLGITDAVDLVSQPGHTCIKDTDATGAPLLANDGRLLTNPNQLVTYSSAPYLAQVNNVTPDKHGTAILASINSISPDVPNPASTTVTYAVRDDSNVPRDLSLQRLKDIYTCVNTSFQPLLPAPGDPTRTAFLNTLGVSPGSCVQDTGGAGNDGRVLTDPQQLVPYSTQTYLDQANNVAPDKHGSSLLGSINAISPTVLNNASVMSRDVYNVVPTAQLGLEPTKSVFVGTGSAVCNNSATIVRNGFNLENSTTKCGDTSIQSH